MLEQFLSIPNGLGLLWLVLTIVSAIIAIVITKITEIEWYDALFCWMISMIFIIACILYGASEIERVNVSDYQWKQIYTNDMDADIQLKPIGFLTNRSGKIIVEAGKPLGDNTYLFADKMSNPPYHIDYDIIAKTNDEKTTKRVEVSKVISDGEITASSKIVKIEYRPYKGYYQKWGSHTGNLIEIPEGSAEIQITIQNETHNKLDDLFSPDTITKKNLWDKVE